MKTVKDIFENIEAPIEVANAYEIYLDGIKNKELGFPVGYLSNALTSGGYRRNKDLDRGVSFWNNVELSDAIRSVLYKEELINSNELIFNPADTADFKNWTQFEYNLFFVLCVLGPENIEDVRNIINYVESKLDKTGFLNHDLPREVRALSYKQMLELIIEFILNNNVKINPVKEMYQLLDNDMSLGSELEAEAAKRFGAKVYRVKVNKSVKTDDPIILKIIKEVEYLRTLKVDFFDDPNSSEHNEAIYLIEI